MNNDTRNTLEALSRGEISVDEALTRIKTEPFEDIGYAMVDLHRKVMQGAPEVIYGESKTAEQIAGIVDVMVEKGQLPILVTRLDAAKAEFLAARHEIFYSKEARIAAIGDKPEPNGIGPIVIATGGTSDIPVAEEAAITLAHKEYITQASVIIAIAGMEGALASVVGGLADCPVIAVPTSVGYGAAFEGLSALLSMLNSCASGVACVNIDNGFGAGYIASRINHMEAKK